MMKCKRKCWDILLYKMKKDQSYYWWRCKNCLLSFENVNYTVSLNENQAKVLLSTHFNYTFFPYENNKMYETKTILLIAGNINPNNYQ